MGLISQAGVTVGLASLLARTFPGPGGEMEALILTLVTLHELVGPLLSRRGLTALERMTPRLLGFTGRSDDVEMRTGAICLAVWLTACGTPPGDPDAGEPDSGEEADGGAGDGGTPDGGSADGGSDAGTSDGGSDAGMPTGRHCGDPIPLTFSGGSDGGTATATGNTGTATTDNTSSSCGGFSTRDLVYSFTTSRLLNLRANLTAVTGTYRPVISLKSACTGSDLACDSAGPGGTASMQRGSLPPATHYLWVDGTSGTTGQYVLDATLEPPDAGDICALAFPLTFSNGTAGGTAFATGSTAGMFDDASAGGCGGSVEPDAVYRFTITQPLNLQVDVTPGAGYQPVVYAWPIATCTTASVTYGCVTAGGPGQAVRYELGSVPAGSHVIWIDGAGGTAGSYSLAASLTPPPQGDACPDPLPLVFSGGLDGGTASTTGDTSAMFNHSYGSCGGLGTKDAVYSFTVDRSRPFTATVTPTTGGYRPVLYLHRSTCSSGSELACTAGAADGGAAAVSLNLTAATYYLWVDGLNSAGTYQLTANLP